MAFVALIQQLKVEYPFRGIDWDARYAEFAPQIAAAEARHDQRAYYRALRTFAWSIPDGHVGIEGDDGGLEQAEIGGSYGLKLTLVALTYLPRAAQAPHTARLTATAAKIVKSLGPQLPGDLFRTSVESRLLPSGYGYTFLFPRGPMFDADFRLQLDSNADGEGGVLPDMRMPVDDATIDALAAGHNVVLEQAEAALRSAAGRG